MINALIVDDEQHCIDTLKWELEEFSDRVNITGTVSNGAEAIKAIKVHEPDLVFLDIDMPDMSGFDVIRKIDKVDFDIIFVTAFDAYALNAIKVSALDYLLKPVDKEDLGKAITKLEQLHELRVNKSGAELERRIELLMEHMNPTKRKIRQVALPSASGYEFIPPEDILYCNSDSNYTQLFLADGRKVLVSKTLKDIQDILPEEHFFRAHHSHLVNLDHIRKYERGDGGTLVMSDGERIVVSRSRKQELLNLI